MQTLLGLIRITSFNNRFQSFEVIEEILKNSLIPLFIGGIIYLYTRSNNIYFLDWISSFLIIPKKIDLPNWIQYNLPDGLWTFASTNLMLIIWSYKISKKTILWIITPLIIGIFLEFTYGTFDPIDLLYIFIGATLPIAINTKFRKL